MLGPAIMEHWDRCRRMGMYLGEWSLTGSRL